MGTPDFINIGALTNRAGEWAISSKNFITNTATYCASKAYEYGQETVGAMQQKIMPYVPSVMRSAEVVGILVITGVALQALVNISARLPVVDTLVATIVAGYALKHPNECAQAIALYAIGSVVVKTLALSTCPLSVVEAVVLYIAALTLAGQFTKVAK